ncbi:heme ABC transporter ATP-binding protein [Mangrovimicrobium sediminis]|uniref:Heme ABC transporter ATP-binding protein n=1 Tax=Mangrovimicrobium sediminis TaxID=2562682 RepID=A0A4Z0M5B7_9GAMM|nr:heme ABC transporter ATP-binding protein [Haliea sp. SAOS-164]TGD74689.1 heme ABC transporter ATP-binding protein [Haliea sp. SAOS-164]
MNALEVSALGAAPYGPPLLHGIDFRLASGEVLGLIGPNGAGKSSLLHCLAGGVGTSGGSIRLAGRELRDWPREARARALAMQTQHASLNFPFTVAEVIQLGRIPHASGRAADRAILEEVLAATDTAALRERRYTQLSGGERQRVQLARAVAQVWRAQDAPTRLLLLDEPSAALDPAHQHMVLDVVARVAAEGCAVVIASHDFNLLAARADHLLVMQDGAQVACGEPATVLTPALFTAVFGIQVQILSHPVSQRPLVVQL